MKQLNLDQKDASPFEQMLSMEQLCAAFKAVRANKGAPGIDGTSVDAFEENLNVELEQLAKEVRN